jgi:hypothetical protein
VGVVLAPPPGKRPQSSPSAIGDRNCYVYSSCCVIHVCQYDFVMLTICTAVLQLLSSKKGAILCASKRLLLLCPADGQAWLGAAATTAAEHCMPTHKHVHANILDRRAAPSMNKAAASAHAGAAARTPAAAWQQPAPGLQPLLPHCSSQRRLSAHVLFLMMAWAAACEGAAPAGQGLRHVQGEGQLPPL